MRIETLFFASYRETVGRSRLEVRLDPGACAADLVAAIRRRGAPFDRLPAEPTVAINERYAPLDTPLEDADTVAFIPPVAGG